MKRTNIVLGIVLICGVFCAITAANAETQSGAVEFKEHCAVCHPEGGNIMNPKKTLHRKDRDANNVKTRADIIKILRSPGPGMSSFNEKTIPEKEASEIAEYILKTFK